MTIPDSIAYPEESDAKYPYTAGRQPGVPRRQGVHRDVRAARRAGRGHDDAALQLLRAQAADPAAGAGGQAGRLGGGAVRQPARPRRRHQPLAGGLRDHRRAVREARQADGRVHRHHPGPDHRRLLRVPRRVLRHPQDQDDARADQADPDPGRRPRRRRAEARGAQRRLDARRRRPDRNWTDCSSGSSRCARKRGAPARSRSTSSRSTPTRWTASSGSRTRASPTSSSASGSPTSWATTPSRSTAKIRNLEWFAENVIAKL